MFLKETWVFQYPADKIKYLIYETHTAKGLNIRLKIYTQKEIKALLKALNSKHHFVIFKFCLIGEDTPKNFKDYYKLKE